MTKRLAPGLPHAAEENPGNLGILKMLFDMMKRNKDLLFIRFYEREK